LTEDQYAAVAEYYDYVRPYRDRADVAFYVDAARSSGGPVLEVGCGTGRVLIPTATAGIDIVGLDTSPQMLQVCLTRLQQEPRHVRARVRLLQGDMRHFTIDQAFALATIPFRPFQHLLTVDDQLACLTRIHRHLADQGQLVFDIFNPSLDFLVTKPIGEEFDSDPEFSMDDGRRVYRRGRIVGHDRFTQVTQHELIYYISHADGRTERVVHAFSMRNTFRFEAEHLLTRAGYEIEHLYADFDRSPYGSKYPGELIFVARKRQPTSAPAHSDQ
jgi:SAM-dependent methyltransferase